MGCSHSCRTSNWLAWETCKQDDAPDPDIKQDKGRKCRVTLIGSNSPNTPSIWTDLDKSVRNQTIRVSV
ncbi:unnamed protein product [Coffea canephora]|uniref:Uncharacterized protein n=1 Tax=Coffea canephora TaxID=49390 RepID=A0A068URQ1_COFCA|nr:unnamed protein product [Coffea canephora]